MPPPTSSSTPILDTIISGNPLTLEALMEKRAGWPGQRAQININMQALEENLFSSSYLDTQRFNSLVASLKIQIQLIEEQLESERSNTPKIKLTKRQHLQLRRNVVALAEFKVTDAKIESEINQFCQGNNSDCFENLMALVEDKYKAQEKMLRALYKTDKPLSRTEIATLNRDLNQLREAALTSVQHQLDKKMKTSLTRDTLDAHVSMKFQWLKIEAQKLREQCIPSGKKMSPSPVAKLNRKINQLYTEKYSELFTGQQRNFIEALPKDRSSVDFRGFQRLTFGTGVNEVVFLYDGGQTIDEKSALVRNLEGEMRVHFAQVCQSLQSAYNNQKPSTETKIDNPTRDKIYSEIIAMLMPQIASISQEQLKKAKKGQGKINIAALNRALDRQVEPLLKQFYPILMDKVRQALMRLDKSGPVPQSTWESQVELDTRVFLDRKFLQKVTKDLIIPPSDQSIIFDAQGIITNIKDVLKTGGWASKTWQKASKWFVDYAPKKPVHVRERATGNGVYSKLAISSSPASPGYASLAARSPLYEHIPPAASNSSGASAYSTLNNAFSTKPLSEEYSQLNRHLPLSAGGLRDGGGYEVVGGVNSPNTENPNGAYECAPPEGYEPPPTPSPDYDWCDPLNSSEYEAMSPSIVSISTAQMAVSGESYLGTNFCEAYQFSATPSEIPTRQDMMDNVIARIDDLILKGVTDFKMTSSDENKVLAEYADIYVEWLKGKGMPCEISEKPEFKDTEDFNMWCKLLDRRVSADHLEELQRASKTYIVSASDGEEIDFPERYCVHGQTPVEVLASVIFAIDYYVETGATKITIKGPPKVGNSTDFRTYAQLYAEWINDRLPDEQKITVDYGTQIIKPTSQEKFSCFDKLNNLEDELWQHVEAFKYGKGGPSKNE